MRTVMKRLLLCVLILSLIGALTGCAALMIDRDYPQPTITYGEFPFELVYSFEGEITTVKGVYVCEYTGLKWNWNIGTYRTWNEYIEGTSDSTLFLFEDGDKKIYCTVGNASYYMNEREHKEYEPSFYENHPSTGYSHALTDEELQQYQLKLISWTYTTRIDNTFE